MALEHRSRIAPLILQDNPHHKVACDYVAAHRRRGAVLVGVLIRQTDYKRWEEGRYFFTYAMYAEIMRELAGEENVQFLVTSDSPLDLALFQGLDVILATGRAGAEGHFMESFFELSLCDIILSPPSSVALMAAYVGKGQLLRIGGKTEGASKPNVKTLSLSECCRDADFSRVA
jgi:hypothetical protein